MGNNSGKGAPAIPKKMNRIVLVESNADLDKAKFELQECDVPVPKSGEVLVRVVAAPVNPSDFGAWKNAVLDPEKPLYLGNEGCGVVVASGGGMKANGLVGANVGIVNMKGGGSYQEYVCVSALEGIFPLPDDCPVQDACSFFVNPYTAVGMCATCEETGSPGFVHTAAASQLGQMLVKLCKTKNMKLINVVRREEQAEILKALGAELIIVSSKEGWKDELAAMVKEHNISCAFDAIAGDSTGDIMGAMPNKSTTFVYGGLSEKPVGGIAAMDLIYRKKQLKGWLLPSYLQGASGGSVGMLMRMNKVAKEVNPGLASGWSSSQFVDVTPEDWWTKFLAMRGGEGFTNKKLRIRWPEPVVPDPPAAPESATAAASTDEQLYGDLEGWDAALTGTFTVAYADAAFSPGDMVAAPKTHAGPPSAVTYTADSTDGKKFTLVMTDPDAPDRTGHAFREFVHYVVSDITAESLAAGGAIQGTTVLDYLGVGAPCKSGLHRYAFLLFEQPEGSTPASLAEAFEGRGGKKVCVAAKAAGLGKVVAATWFQSEWDESIDAVHVAMGWLPPPEFRSPTQEAANPSTEAPKEEAASTEAPKEEAPKAEAPYKAETVQAAWDNHFGAFGTQDVAKIMLDYTEESELRAWDHQTQKLDSCKGMAQIQKFFEGLFATLKDTSDLAAPTIDVTEDPKQVYLIWSCTASGIVSATDSFIFDDDNKISRQNIAFTSKEAPIEP